MKRLLHILALLLISFEAMAQSFPVQVTPQVIPPNPVYLSDYANPSTTTDRVRVQLLLNDLTVSNREVRLKLYIEGQGILAQSNDVVIGAPTLFVDGGIPLQLGSAELAPYFEFQNLQGINPNAYGAALPEGAYQMCFEVYDVLSGNRLSQKTCATFILFQNEPPFLNLPYNESVIVEQNPLNIVFQWTPRHINVSNVQYEFSLVEIWDNYIDPQAAFLTSPPIFQTVTTQTTLIYGPAFPQLLTGKRYAWRVRAFATNGAEEIGVFTNQGFSEIFWFAFQTQCNAPTFVTVEELGDRHAKINWQGDISHLDYTIKYREKNAGSEWYELTTPREYITINDLARETTYEYKILGNCDFGSFGETIIYEFTTLSEEASAYIGCNIEPDPIDLSNQTLLTDLYINDIFTAGDFPVTVVQLDQPTAPFKGGGYVVVPWLGDTKIAVEFEGIQINTDMKLVAGEVKTTYDAQWGDIGDIDDLIEDIVGDDGDIGEYDAGDLDIDDIIVGDDGEIIIIDEDGIEHPIDVDLPVIITDENGDQWLVDEDGTVTPLGEEADGGAPDDDNTDGMGGNGTVNQISSPDVSIVFKESGFYTVDEYPDGITDLQDKYETIPTANGGTYKVVYKALSDLPASTTDVLIADATFSNGKTKDDIVFKTLQGTAVDAQWNAAGNQATLQLTKQFEFAKSEILATVKPADSTQNYTIAGKTNVWHFDQQNVNVTIVPLNGASPTSNLASDLNAIYNKAGVNFNITIDNPLNIDASVWDIDVTQGSLDIGDSDLLSNYTAEERAIYEYYESQRGIDAQQYYVFLADTFSTTDSNIQGFMPRKRQYGFLFTQNDQALILAHELGHGVFGLDHYDESGSQDLLMHANYPMGTKLTHMDWETIHAPGLQLYLFQSDESGQLAGKVWLTPDWKPFKFASSGTISSGDASITKGAIPGIVYDKKHYKATFSGNQFLGYLNESDPDPLPISIQTLANADDVHLFRDVARCGSNTYYKTTWGYIKGKQENFSFVDNSDMEFQGIIPCVASQEDTSSRCDQFTYFNLALEEDQNLMEVYQEAVDAALERALTGGGYSATNLIRPKGVFRHMQFANVTGEALEDSEMEIIEDKLHLLNYHDSNTQMVVTFLKVENNRSLYNYQIQDMAERALDHKQGLVGSKKVVYVIVPYSNFESILGVLNDVYCFNIGFGESQDGLVTNVATFPTGSSVFKDILEVYKYIEKPLFVKQFFMKADGSMVETRIGTTDGQKVSGYDAINALRIYKSKYLTQIENLRSQSLSLITSFAMKEFPTTQQTEQFIADYNAIKEQINEQYVLAAFNENVTQASHWEDPQLDNLGALREVFILDEEVALAYFASQTASFGYGQKFSIFFGFNDQLDYDLHFYDFDIFSVIDPIVYGVADVLSLIPIPYADTVGDTIGLVYATARGDMSQAPFYALGLALPVGTAYLKAGNEAAQSVFVIAARQADDGAVELVKRTKNDLQPGEVIVTSPLTEKADIADAVLNNLKKDENMPKIAKYFDEAIQAGANLFAFLTPKPANWTDEMVDTFKQQFNQGSDGFKELFNITDVNQKIELAQAWKVMNDAGRVANQQASTVVLIKSLNELGETGLRSRLLNELSDDFLKKFSDDFATADDVAAFAQKYSDNDKMFDAWKRMRQEAPNIPLCN